MTEVSTPRKTGKPIGKWVSSGIYITDFRNHQQRSIGKALEDDDFRKTSGDLVGFRAEL